MSVLLFMANKPKDPVADMRNKLTHEYFAVDLEIVWNTVKKDLPKFEAALQKIVKVLMA